jgi:hypothetical protein
MHLVPFALLIAVLAPIFSTTACASNASGASRELKLAPTNMLPMQMQNAPTRVREAYQFAVANPDALKNVPCYCGCGAIGHTSNYACYVKQAKADGTVVFDDHALGCSVCVDIAQDVMKLTREGKSPPDIRAFIVATYSQFGPPNQ